MNGMATVPPISIGPGFAACYNPFEKDSRTGRFCARTEMEVTVELNGKKEKAEVSFAQPADFAFVKSWKEAIGTDQNPIRTDTVEYAQLAVKKYEASFGSGKYANSLRDFSDHILSNPKVEVGGFVVLQCDWYPGSRVIGFAHFRRTWCNKIVLDYFGRHD